MNLRLAANLTTFAVVAVAAVLWAATSLFGGGSEPAARVVAELEATGGLRPASDVTYLGQAVGRVEQVELAPGMVEAWLRLDRDDLPREVTATVRRRSAVGEPYLDLAPIADAPRPPEGPTLVDGDRIELARTALPRSYSELFASVARLFDAVEADDVATVLTEVTTALDGRGGTVQRILRDGAAVAATLADRSDVIERAIDEVGAVTATLADRSSTIATTFDDLADIGDAIDDLGGDYATLLRQDDAFLSRSTQLLRDVRGDLGCTVTSLREVADALDATTLAELEDVLDLTPRVREIITRARDDRPDGSTFLTVNVLLSSRPVGGQPPRRDRDPQPSPLGSCEEPAPLTDVAGDADERLDDRGATATAPGASAPPVERGRDDDGDPVATSTDRDLRGASLPIGWILVALGAVAILGAVRPWRAWSRGT